MTVERVKSSKKRTIFAAIIHILKHKNLWQDEPYNKYPFTIKCRFLPVIWTLV